MRPRRAFHTSPQPGEQTPSNTPDLQESSSSSKHPSTLSLHPPPFRPLFLSPPTPPAPRSHSSPPLSPPSLLSSLLRLLSHRPLRRLTWLLLVLLAPLCLLPGLVQGSRFRVGVVGPWGCDPLFAKALPSVAAQLAVNRINSDPSLAYGTTFDYVILQEPCETSRALEAFLGFYPKASGYIGPANPGYCDAATLLAKGWSKAVFSWNCVACELDDVRNHPTFARSLPSATRVLLTLLEYFGWAHVGIISSSEEFWVETANMVSSSLRSHSIPVILIPSMENSPHSIRKTLARVQKRRDIRLLILCMHSALMGGGPQQRLLETAYDMKMTDGSLVFLPYDTLLYSLPHRNVTYPALRSNGKLRRAYDAMLTVTIDSPKVSFYEAYGQAMERGELARNVRPQEVSPLFGTIYSSVLLMAHAVHSVKASGEWLSGGNVARHTRSLDFQGFSHPMKTSASRAGLVDYIILDTEAGSWELRATHRIDMEVNRVRFLGTAIHFPDGFGPWGDSACWFTHRGICVNLLSVVSIFLGVLIISVCVGFLTYVIRRRIIQIRLVRGPDKIKLTLADVRFINPSLSNKKMSMDSSNGQSISEHSISIQTPPTYENSNVAIFEGDWAWMKKLPNGSFRGMNPKTTDVFELMKDMRHENINPFLGFFQDCGVFAIVTDYCSRRSLEDLLYNHDVKLDWMFKSSLLLDLIKGMKYLHHRELVHGRLKSRNCVVDGRFVLKVTDYGFNRFLDAQRIPYVEPPPEELLWTAPEILRGGHPGLYGSFPGDVYSFAIIIQEVVMRGRPFCMLDLPAADVIQKLCKPPPLCRPVVSPDYAPLECLELMQECWNEQADRRPGFEHVHDQFKNINKGRKTNIIDSMLRMLEQYSSNLEELIRERTEELEIEKLKTEKLLTQMLPPSVAKALKQGTTVEPEHFSNVSLYFSDIVGFTTISANSEPIEVVDLLNDLYTVFDAIIGNHDVYKVETIGDAYMVASGLPVPNGDRHAAEISNMALDILSAVGSFKMRHMPDVPVRIRIGLHSGPCVAGVVGLTMPRYCLFGDTVNTASRMESSGMPQRIHVHSSTVKILLALKMGYKVVLRGKTDLKGKGAQEETYWLVGKEGFTKPLPIPPEVKSKPQAQALQIAEINASKKRKAEQQRQQQQLAKKKN